MSMPKLILGCRTRPSKRLRNRQDDNKEKKSGFFSLLKGIYSELVLDTSKNLLETSFRVKFVNKKIVSIYYGIKG